MAIEIWIDDGDPVYMSPDIWVVPGNDPEGEIGVPVVNSNSFVWARVHNRGTSHVSNARVDFYWGDPSTGVTRSNATLIGTSYVSLESGETKEVLCLTPWIPDWVNEGHECLIVEAYSPEDPLNTYPDADRFYVADDRHIAQRNVNILSMKSSSAALSLPFYFGNWKKNYESEFKLIVKRSDINAASELLKQLGFKKKIKELPQIKEYGMLPYRCGDEIEGFGKQEMAVKALPGEKIGMLFRVKLPSKRKPNEGAFFLIEQYDSRNLIGGIGVFIVDEDNKHK
jgi:hypothetical protein